MRRGRSEVGQTSPLIVVVLAGAAVAALAIARLGAVAVERAEARTAADAAALAGAAAGRPGALAAAGANGGVLERYTDDGGFVEVVVRVGTVEAVARAERAGVASTRGHGPRGRRLGAHVGGPASGW